MATVVNNCTPFMPSVTVAPFTQPVQGGNIAPLFHLAVLHKRYKHGMGGRGIVVPPFTQAAELVKELNQHLCEKGETAGLVVVSRHASFASGIPAHFLK